MTAIKKIINKKINYKMTAFKLSYPTKISIYWLSSSETTWKIISTFYCASPVIIIKKDIPLPPCRQHGGKEYSSYLFLTSALDRGEWSASRPSHTLLPVPIG
jgi:hypothetical protein